MINGTIEGFFGRHWTHSDRLAHCDFLKKLGYDFYIYAPKSDHFLRRSWHQDWSDKEWGDLQQLSDHCRCIGLNFGIGFSPFELHLSFDCASKHKLDKKMQRINQLAPDTLCILFDDMRGDIAKLAEIQVAIVDQVQGISTARHCIICPSYYSEDPVLDKVFGQRPDNYLEDLGRLLPKEIDIFWTGAKVCSPSFDDREIELVTEKLRRKPFLWDNYPVNDGAKLCGHLHLEGFKKRDNLNAKNIAGHAINPMNQAWLSRIPLACLPAMYSAENNSIKETHNAIIELCPEPFARQLIKDLELFQQRGLTSLCQQQRQDKADIYRTLQSASDNNHYSQEVIDWLEGKYQFDPNCLTD